MHRWFVLSALLLSGLILQAQNIGVAVDSDIPRESWFKALKRGRINPADTTIAYPRIVIKVWDTVRETNRWLNPYDTAYVVGTGKKFKVTLKNNNWFDDYDFRDDGMMVEFHSNPSSDIGASVSAFGLSLGYSMSFDRLMGKRNRSKKFELGFTCARFSLEYYRIINQGDMTLTFHLEGNEKLRWRHFSGIKRKSWGINAYYFFNNQHYAPTAAYNFSKVQCRSVGSWLAGVGASHRNFTIKLKDIPEELRMPDYEEEIAATNGNYEETMFDYTDFSLIGGYGFNWVLGRRWLLNVTGLLYSGIKHALPQAMSAGGHTFWAVNGKARMGIAYNPGHIFCGLQGQIDSHFFNTGDYRFRSHLYDVTLVAGVQF